VASCDALLKGNWQKITPRRLSERHFHCSDIDDLEEIAVKAVCEGFAVPLLLH
jgi:hypothetical protein